MELDEYIEKLADVRDGLDEKIRECRGLMKDIEKLNKEIQAQLQESVVEVVDNIITNVVNGKMEQLAEHAEKTIVAAEKKIFDRFDSLSQAILGKTPGDAHSMETLLLAKAMLDGVLEDAAERERAIIYKAGTELPPALQRKKPKKKKPEGIKPPWVV